MAITVKKKKMTPKSSAPADVEGGVELDAVETDNAVVAAVMQGGGAPARKSGGSFVPFVIIGLLACALLGALIAMQFIENSFYTGAIPQYGTMAPR